MSSTVPSVVSWALTSLWPGAQGAGGELLVSRCLKRSSRSSPAENKVNYMSILVRREFCMEWYGAQSCDIL